MDGGGGGRRGGGVWQKDAPAVSGGAGGAGGAGDARRRLHTFPLSKETQNSHTGKRLLTEQHIKRTEEISDRKDQRSELSVQPAEIWSHDWSVALKVHADNNLENISPY